MDKVLVLCIAEVTRRYGYSTSRYQDSVMIEAEFEDQVKPTFDYHFGKIHRRDPAILEWKLVSYLPQQPLKKGKRVFH
jgi:hypothetical protein